MQAERWKRNQGGININQDAGSTKGNRAQKTAYAATKDKVKRTVKSKGGNSTLIDDTKETSSRECSERMHAERRGNKQTKKRGRLEIKNTKRVEINKEWESAKL